MAAQTPDDGVPPAALVDVDGTLVDSNYQHAMAWYRALRSFGVVREIRGIHRLLGMGGDHLVEEIAGPDVECESGDGIRAAHDELFAATIEEVAAIPRATELLRALKDGGGPLVLASSADAWQVEHYLDLLGARDLVDAWISGDDVDGSKPDPDLVEVGRERAGGGPAVMIGDSTWDCVAARRAGVPTVALTTGGFSREELRQAGALSVFDSLDELIDHLPLGRG